jgi:hypothetical protein
MALRTQRLRLLDSQNISTSLRQRDSDEQTSAERIHARAQEDQQRPRFPLSRRSYPETSKMVYKGNRWTAVTLLRLRRKHPSKITTKTKIKTSSEAMSSKEVCRYFSILSSQRLQGQGPPARAELLTLRQSYARPKHDH